MKVKKNWNGAGGFIDDIDKLNNESISKYIEMYTYDSRLGDKKEKFNLKFDLFGKGRDANVCCLSLVFCRYHQQPLHKSLFYQYFF